MNEKLPCEEKLPVQLNDLTLPDEDMAWQDMKRRLEEDDDDRIIVPPPVNRGCAGWGLLLLLLLVGAWVLLKPQNWFNKKNEKQTVQIKPTGNNNDTVQSAGVINKIKNKNSEILKTDSSTNELKTNPVIDNPGSSELSLKKAKIDKNESTASPQIKVIQQKEETVFTTKPKQAGISISFKPSGQIKKENSTIKENRKILNTYSRIITKGSERESIATVTGNDSIVTLPQVSKDTTADTVIIKYAKTDSIKKGDTAILKPATKNNAEKEKKRISFSAGAAMQQQLPFFGQKFVPYNSLGRKGTLADYIPSVYFRVHKDQKWFIQAEFKYGAPQYNKEFLYNQKTKSDTILKIDTTTSLSLKKSYYHQLPISFNHFITPNWSIGTGLVWNKFFGAVSEQQINKKNLITGNDSVLTKRIITGSGSNDSGFVKSYFQALFETQYKWKRFTVGARYSFGLQPYIKFTLPGTGPLQQKNKSINIFLRYELWKSKKKPIKSS
jgi:hypothetical protein